MSKNILWIAILALLVSCQDKIVSESSTTTTSEQATKAPAASETPKTSSMQESAKDTAVVNKAAADKAAADKAAADKAAADKAAADKAAADKAAADKAAADKVAADKAAADKAAADKVAADKAAADKAAADNKKVVAPVIQGKQPIKQQPNPAPSEIMLKADSGMTLAKANGLTKKCKSCHATDKDKVGPSFKKIQAAYGSANALTAVFESGFAVESRKVAMADAKWKKKAKTMTSQYKNLIQKQVKKGKLTYKEMAEAIFAK